MLVYANTNFLSMFQRFTSEEAVRVAAGSIYFKKTAMGKLDDVKTNVAPNSTIVAINSVLPA